jgi:group II intron maturase
VLTELGVLAVIMLVGSAYSSQSRKFTEQVILIKSLSPVITGWTRYHSTVVSKTAFAYLDHILFSILLARTSH